MQYKNIEDFHLQLEQLIFKLKYLVSNKIDNVITNNQLQTKSKHDNTIVTQVDLYISDLFKNELFKYFPDINFYSEEDKCKWKFPLVILDPIDGTKELVKGVGECAVSFGVYFSDDFLDERNFSWIFNPFTGFEISSLSPYINGNYYNNNHLLSLVSKTEFDKNFHINNDHITYIPKGSIAYKLGLLASGSCDFVISKMPKNIWDIAAGTHICLKRGIHLFQNGQEIFKISKELYNNDLLWTHKCNYSSLIKKFKYKK